MIYLLQVRMPWVSNIYWHTVAAFSSADEARATDIWNDSAQDQARLIEVPAIGTLGCLVESYYPEDDSCD